MAIEKKDPNEDIKRRLEEYLERLLPTLYIIRYGLNKDINQMIDATENKLNTKHKSKLKILTLRS